MFFSEPPTLLSRSTYNLIDEHLGAQHYSQQHTLTVFILNGRWSQYCRICNATDLATTALANLSINSDDLMDRLIRSFSQESHDIEISSVVYAPCSFHLSSINVVSRSRCQINYEWGLH